MNSKSKMEVNLLLQVGNKNDTLLYQIGLIDMYHTNRNSRRKVFLILALP